MTPFSKYDSWLPMGEVLKQTGMSERTIYRHVRLGKLKQAQRPIPGRKPLPVFDPADVAQLAELALKAAPEILPPVDAMVLRDAVEVARTAILQRQAPLAGLPPSELRFIAYLSIQEAMLFTGLPEKTIQRFAREGRVGKIGTRYRRKDLEAL